MALEFRGAPEWLLQEYMNRKTPLQEASEGVGTAINSYLAFDESNRKNKLAEQTLALAKQKQELEGRQNFYKYGDPSMLQPGEQQALSVAGPQGPVTAAGAPPQEEPTIAYFRQRQKLFPQGTEVPKDAAPSKFQQVPILIDGKPSRFNPISGQYEVAQVVDPSATGSGGQPIQDPAFTPRVPPPTSAQFVGMQDGKPILLNPKTGKMEQGTLPGSGPLTAATQTEGQANAKLYADRMDAADAQLNQLEKQADLTSFSSGAQEKMPNWMKSENIQLFEQAKRNFLNAVLRRESGAVISPSEFADGNKQYFPVMGDSPAVLQQKAANRRTAREGLRNAAGGGSTAGGVANPSSVPMPSGPQPGMVENGYRFKGGNPGDPGSWEKI